MNECRPKDGQQKSDAGNERSSVMPSSCQIAKRPGARCSQNAEWHGQEASFQGSETQIVDDDATKVDKATIWNVDENIEKENDPNLDVQ